MANNLESYSVENVVDYYKELCQNGCFEYESVIIERYFPKKSMVLDIGCGAGRTTIALKEDGYKVVGIDYSVKMIETAIRLNREIDYYVQDARNMDFEDCSFDCAIFSFNGLMLLERFEERKQVLLEIRRVLKLNGIFFFTTPFLDNKIDKGYWNEKVRKYGKNFEQLSSTELLELGNEITEEGNVEFQLHIPFVSEIQNLVTDCGYDILFEGRRLDYFIEEKLEDELDDNYLWVVIKKNV